MSDSIRKWAYAGLLFVGFAWAIGPVTIRLLKDTYDPYTLALVRYIAAVFPLLGYSLVFHRTGLKAALRLSKALIPLAVLNVLMLLTWTIACFETPAVTAQLVVKVSVIFVVVLSFIVFHEERRVIRDPGYILGTIVSFIGVTIVLTEGSFSVALLFKGSTFLIIFTAALWAFYAISMKHLVTNIHPVPVFAVLAVYSMIGIIITASVMGDLSTIAHTDARTAGIGFVSGFVPIALAHPVYHFAQKHLGSAFCSSWTLLNPFFTFLVSLVLLPDETLGWIPLLGGCILIAGTLWVTIVSNRAGAAHEAANTVGVGATKLATATGRDE
jgi:drug/metabolite transporter (DMT)-like permease